MTNEVLPQEEQEPSRIACGTWVLGICWGVMSKLMALCAAAMFIITEGLGNCKPILLIPGLPSPCIPSIITASLAVSCPYGPLMKLPPSQAIEVALDAQARASALIVQTGTPHLGEAHAGVLGTPSSFPST